MSTLYRPLQSEVGLSRNELNGVWALSRPNVGQSWSPPGTSSGISGAGSVMSLQSVNSGARSSPPRIMEQFEMTYVAEPEKRFFCISCEQVMRYPVQFGECGHRCCSGCIQNIIRVAPRCPIDQARIEPSSCFVDKAFQWEIECLQVKCVYVSKGCQWTGSINDLKVHHEVCDFFPVICSRGCGLTFGRCFLVRHLIEDCRCFLVRHLIEDCPRREKKCELCDEPFVFCEAAEHVQICRKFVVGCPNNCGNVDLTRGELEEHLTLCPETFMKCPFERAGCAFEGFRKVMDEHQMRCFNDHYNMVVRVLADIQVSKAALTSKVGAKVEQLQMKTGLYRAINSDPLLWRIEDWSTVYQRAQSGKAVSINGPCVTTGTLGLGYRISLCVYPYGEGIDQGRFMSVFICLCRTDADNLLKWPFELPINVMLVDQSPQANGRKRFHITQQFDPTLENPKAVCRPTAERGLPFGKRQFVRLEMMTVPDRYVFDDTVVFRVEVG